MRRCEFYYRDGLAGTGLYTTDNGGKLSLPGAYEMEEVFPDLAARTYSNVPPLESVEFVEQYFSKGDDLPFEVHPELIPDILSGECVITPNWNTIIRNPRNFVKLVLKLKSQIPPDTAWYLPAAALPENAAVLVYSGFDLFDFTGVDLKSSQGIFCMPDGDYPAEAMQEGMCTCPGCLNGDLKEHNRRALVTELAVIKHRIKSSTFKELLEARCRTRPEYVSILRHLEKSDEYCENYTPVTRAAPLLATSGDSLNRIEVRRFMQRVLERYIPPKAEVAVLLPCSVKKPYSLSQSHRKFVHAIDRRAHELIVTSPLGLVPRELELVYPASHYDVPVTGYWDHEERFVIREMIAKYLLKHRYRRVIAHLDGDSFEIAKEAAEIAGVELECTCSKHPTSHEDLKVLHDAVSGERKVKRDMVRGMLSYQFGYVPEISGMVVKGRYPEQSAQINRRQIFSIDTSTGYLRPTFEGWSYLETGYRVYIDDFVPQGDILAPGVVEADPDIREGDEVLVIGERARATGRAAMGADEMLRSNRGVAVRVRKVKKL